MTAPLAVCDCVSVCQLPHDLHPRPILVPCPRFLVQVFGYKYVRLYSPEDTPNLYPIKSSAAAPTAAAAGAASGGKADATTSQGNISAVDVEAPDFTAHPLARSARYYETVLGPGDVLYIPANWWHFVRSLTPSFSINFWF